MSNHLLAGRRRIGGVAGLLLALAIQQSSARADPLWGSYLAGNGAGSASLTVSNAGNGVHSDLVIEFVTPPTGTYRIDSIETTAWQTAGSGSFLHATVATTINGTGLNWQTNPPLSTSGPQLVTLTSGFGQNLSANTLYYLTFSVDTGSGYSQASIAKTSAGVTGPLHTGKAFNWTTQPNAVYPALRINAHPVPPISPVPAYSAFSTIGSPPPPFTATIYLEIICPGPTNPFTCPVGFTVPATPSPTSAQVCQSAANAINTNTGGCWGVGGGPGDFHAYCSGNVLRVTNTTPGVCAGAMICIDHVENLNKFQSKGGMSYEYFAVKLPLVLQFRNAASGRRHDPTADNAVWISISRQTRCWFWRSCHKQTQIRVPVVAGMTAEQLAKAVERALRRAGDREVRAKGSQLRIEPGRRSRRFAPTFDIAVRVNDAAIDWALTPFEGFLEVSDRNLPPVFER